MFNEWWYVTPERTEWKRHLVIIHQDISVAQETEILFLNPSCYFKEMEENSGIFWSTLHLPLQLEEWYCKESSWSSKVTVADAFLLFTTSLVFRRELNLSTRFVFPHVENTLSQKGYLLVARDTWVPLIMFLHIPCHAGYCLGS